MKHRASSNHRTDAPDRHNGQKHKQTNGRVFLSVSLFVRCVLDGLFGTMNCVSASRHLWS